MASHRFWLIAIVLILAYPTVSSGQYFSNHYFEQQWDLDYHFQRNRTTAIYPKSFKILKFNNDLTTQEIALLKEAIDSLENSQERATIVNLSKLLHANPRVKLAHYYLAIAYRQLSAPQSAVNELTKFLFVNPNSAAAYLELGINLIGLSYGMDASDKLKKALELDPSLAEAHYYLALISYEGGFAKNALARLDDCLSVDPRYKFAYLMQGIIKAEARARQGFKIKDDALLYFEKALAIDPDFVGALYWRGLLYYQLDRPQEALSDWDHALRLRPLFNRLLFYEASVYVMEGDFASAFTKYKTALVDNRFAKEYNYIGYDRATQPNDFSGLAIYLVTHERDLTNQETLLFRKSLCLAFVNRANEALVNIDDSLKQSAPNLRYYFKAIIYEKLKRYDSAFKYFDKTLEVDNNIFELHRRRGSVYALRGDWKNADIDLREMKRIWPGSDLVSRLQAEIRRSRGDYYGALIEYTAYLKKDSLDTDILKSRAFVRNRLSDFKGSNEDFMQVYNLTYDTLLFQDMSANYAALNDTAGLVKCMVIISQISYLNSDDHLMFARNFAGLQRPKEADIEYTKWARQRFKESKSPNYRPAVYTPEQDSEYYYQLAVDDLQNGDTTKAMKNISASIKSNPKNIASKYIRAKIYFSEKKYQQAIGELESLKTAGYKDSNTLYDQAYKELHPVKPAPVIPEEKDPYEAHLQKALLKIKEQSFAAASKEIASLEELRPNDVMIEKLHGLLKFGQGNYYGAIIDLSKYLEREPNDIDALAARAKARIKVNDTEGAKADKEKIAKINGGK